MRCQHCGQEMVSSGGGNTSGAPALPMVAAGLGLLGLGPCSGGATWVLLAVLGVGAFLMYASSQPTQHCRNPRCRPVPPPSPRQPSVGSQLAATERRAVHPSGGYVPRPEPEESEDEWDPEEVRRQNQLDYEAERASIHRMHWQRWADDNDFYGSFEEYGDVMGPDAPDDW